ncbi:MAG TPA: T9SS type A sorting domain-containing protein [Ignavibacteria bacterium]|nr:T9SS type A sorting domain-containing protein [Ignavibacteria bacterium]
MKSIICVLINSLFFILTVRAEWVPAGEMSAGNTDVVRALTGDDSGNLFASSWARGVYRSTNGGVSWEFSGLTGKRVSCLSIAPDGTVYGLSMTQDYSYIHRSTDNGLSWTDVFTGSFPLNYAGGGEIVYPGDGSIVAAFSVTVGPTIGNVSTFVYKSTDSGNSWNQTQVIGAGFAGGMIITDDERILLGTSLGGVVYSQNNGLSFQNFTTFPPIFIRTILKDELNTIYVGDAYGLNRSTDNGLTFTDIGNHSSGIGMRTACVSSEGELFVSMDSRDVFYSDDKGNNWTLINEGLPEGTYFLKLSAAGGRIYGGTNNRGVMVFDIPTNAVNQVQIAQGFELRQNYPNPFNPSTNLEFVIPESEFVSLKIYDAPGKEIKTLVNETRSAGRYAVTFDGSGLQSGVYFYKIEAGDFVQVKKMLLLK